MWESVRALWQSDAKRGEAGKREAIRLLRDYWSTHLTREEALHPLLKLLGKQERFREAEDLYVRLVQALKEEGRTPDRRTSEFIESLRAMRGWCTATPPTVVEIDSLSSHSSLLHDPLDLLEDAHRGMQRKQTMDKRRRSLLRMGVSTTASLLHSTPLYNNHVGVMIAERMLRTIKNSAIDDVSISHLMDTTQNNRKRFVLSKSSAYDLCSLQQDMFSHLLTLEQLLKQPLSTRIRGQLCTLIGETTQLLGDLCFHQGKNDIASSYYNVAIEAAIEGQNDVLHAVILGRKSFIPIYGDNAFPALPFLHKAHTLVSRTGSDVVQAWLMALEAEAHATMGEADASEQALQQSAFLLDRAQDDRSTCYFPVEIGYASFDPQRLQGYRAACSIHLRKPQQAESILVDLLSKPHLSPHTQSIHLIDLARTYALQGVVEPMYQCAHQAMDILEKTQSVSVLHRMLNLRQKIQKWQNTYYVRQLDQKLEAITSTSQQFERSLSLESKDGKE